MLFQITSCLPRGMCAMIVQDNSNPLIFMVFFIEDLQEVNEICALVSFPNKRDNFTCYQIHACQQRNSSMPLIFTISANKTMFHRWQKIFSNIPNCLNSRLFIIGDRNHIRFTIVLELHFYLLIYDEHVIHFRVEIRVCLLYTSDAADDLLCVDLGG